MNSGLRVLMTADTVGGVFSYAIELASALAAGGAQIALATLGGPLSPGQQRAALAIPGLSLFASDYQLEWMDDPWDDVARSGEWLLDLERKLRPDVVHLASYAHAARGFVAPTIVVAHSCVLSWWDAVLGDEAPPRYDRYRFEVRRGLDAAAAVVAPTRAMLDALIQQHGPVPRSRVIAHAIDPLRAQPAEKEPMIFTLGRLWDPAKNLALLGSIAERLPWPVRAGGSSVHPDGHTRVVPGIEALGVLPPREAARWLGRAAIYAHPALYEPFGLAVAEAALAGCALVLGDLPSLREIWGDERAIYVDPRDPDELEHALRFLIRRPGIRAELGQRARDRALARTPEAMARAHLALYAEVLGERSPAASSRRSELCA
jgi:glycosyltransferase involved in cell wall biosynthesis